MIAPLKNRPLLLAYCCLFLASYTFAQQRAFDSLKQLIPATKAPDKKAMLLIAVAKSIYNSIPDSSIGYCEQAETISRAKHLDVQLGYALHCESRYLLLKGDVKSTIEKLNAAIALFEKHHEQTDLAKCYSLKSIALDRIGKNREELEYLLKAKAIYDSMPDKEGLASILLNLCNAYTDIGAFDNAISTLEEIKRMNLPPSGTNFYLEVNYGNVYFNRYQYADAVLHYKKATEIAHEFHMLDSEITGLTLTAESYRALNNSREAQHYYELAIALAKENKLLVEEKDALKGTVELYERGKNFQQAFLALKRFKLIEDSLFTIEKIKSINNIEHKLRISDKEKIIAEQGLSLEKEKVALASSRNNTLLLVAGLIIILIAFAFLFYYTRKTRKLVSLIQLQKTEVERQKEVIESKNKDVMDSIHYARHIQGSMLPSAKLMDSLFKENFVLYKPKDVVAGDFYWTERIDGKPALAVCDCTGHGVPGAMVSIVACNALNRAVKEFGLSDPARIFDKVNQLMQETFSKSDYEVTDGMDGVLCVFDQEAMKLHVAMANNPVWLVSPPGIKTGLWEEAWQFSQLSPDKQPIGKFKEELSPFQLKTVSLEKGEMIYLFSDGYADQFGGEKGKKFKYKQLQELLVSIARLPLSEQREKLHNTMNAWQGALEQVDDILIVGIRV